MRLVIRLGDPTSHGGKVASAAGNFNIMGKDVARLGDVCTCPIPGHNNCTIAEGDPTYTIDGRPVALEGHKTSCGATLISTCSKWGRSYEGDGGVASVPFFDAEKISRALSANAAATDDQFTHDQHFHLADEVTGKPLAKRFYRMTCNERVVEGYTDEDGRTAKVEAGDPADVKIEIFPEGYAGALA